MLGDKRFSSEEGFYVLMIQLDGRSEKDVNTLLRALWSCPEFQGCGLDANEKLEAQIAVSPRWSEADGPDQLCGNVGLFSNDRVAVATLVTDWISPLEQSVGRRRLEVLIPMWEVRKCELQHGSAWRKSLEDWFATVARRAFEEVQFSSGLIGHNGGDQPTDKLDREGLERVPRGYALLRRGEGRLDYFPTTDWPTV